MFYHNYIKGILIAFFLTIGFCYGDPYWVPFMPDYPEGAEPEYNLVTSDANHTIVEVFTPGMWVEDVTLNGYTFQRLSITDIIPTHEIGKAELPALCTWIGVDGTTDYSVNILEDETITLEDYFVYPYQTPENRDDPEGDGFDFDEEFYQSEDLYPFEEVNGGNAGIWRDVRLINPGIYPIRYTPVARELAVHYYIKFEVVYSGENEENTKQNPTYPVAARYAEAYRRSIINYDALGYEETDYEKPRYLIITHSSLQQTLQPLVTWLRQTGKDVKVANQNEVGTDRYAVHNYIKNDYQGHRTAYVLLVGDIDLIPIHWVAKKASNGGDRCPTDYRYSLLAGEDLLYDCAVGRLSVFASEGLEDRINKIINYAKCVQGGNWPNNLILVSSIDEKNPPGIGNKLRVELYPYRKEQPNIITDYAGYGARNGSVGTHINYGCGLVNYLGHGEWDRWKEWSAPPTQSWTIEENVMQLNNNGKVPVVFSCCCLNAELDHEYMAPINVLWMGTSNKRAVAAIGSTRACPMGWSDNMDVWFFRVLYDEGFTEVGDCLNHAKGDLAKKARIIKSFPNYASDILFMFLLLGEPSMDIRTNASLITQTTHPSNVALGAAHVEVEVVEEVGATPVEKAVVCLFKEGDVHEAYTTGTDGFVAFDIETDAPGEITVTVTKHGYVPYQGTITVE